MAGGNEDEGLELVMYMRSRILYLVSGLVFKETKKSYTICDLQIADVAPHHVADQSLSSALAHLSSAEVCGKPAVLLPSGAPWRTSGWRSHRGCSVCTSSGLPADPAGFGSRERLGAQQPHRCEQYRSHVNLKRMLVHQFSSHDECEVRRLLVMWRKDGLRSESSRTCRHYEACSHTEVVKTVKKMQI